MKKALFLLLILSFHPCLAELYKCSTTAGTTYQDKPCQTSQIQKIIPQVAYKPTSQSVVQPTAVPTYHSLSIERDAHGKIKRSEKAKDDFKAANPCPANGKRAGSCSGYVIDHISALACGGADSPENMQWQTIAQGKEKDGWERDGCKSPTKQPSYNQSPSDSEEYKSKTVYIGKHGGRYVLTKSSKKRYLPNH